MSFFGGNISQCESLHSSFPKKFIKFSMETRRTQTLGPKINENNCKKTPNSCSKKLTGRTSQNRRTFGFLTCLVPSASYYVVSGAVNSIQNFEKHFPL